MQPGISSQSAESIRDRAVGALLGLAVGDAIGTTLEFGQRDTYPHLTDMVGGGPFGLEAGMWTDDTSMALALADSLLEKGGLDEADLMTRFCAWREEGRYSCAGHCFDIGDTVSTSLDRWLTTGDPIAGSTNPDRAGNGSLMRLAPIALRFWNDLDALKDAAARQSRTTHAAGEAVDACVAYAQILAAVIAGQSLDAALDMNFDCTEFSIIEIMQGSWRNKPRNLIGSSGYVVHSLEASLWSVGGGASFADSVLTAANLGGDADTTAAITGQLAGALYGLSGIPLGWRNRVSWSKHIIEVAERLLER